MRYARKYNPEMRRYDRMPIRTERDNKSDLIKAALEARGLEATDNYRDDTVLTVGGGEWTVSLRHSTKGGNRQYLAGSISATSFDELLATITDDVKFAQHCYMRSRQHNRLYDAERYAFTDYGQARRAYGDAAVAAAMQAIEDPEDWVDLGTKQEKLAAAYKTLQGAVLERDVTATEYRDYVNAIPTSEEQAQAFLAVFTQGGQ